MNQKCKDCGISKNIKHFSKAGTRADGSVRYRTSCRECQSKTRSVTSTEERQKRIYEWEAPLSAAMLLMQEYPEALADLVRRWHHVYTPLLEAERKRMLKIAS